MTVDSGTYTDATLASRRRLAESMMQRGADTSPIGSHWQGLARIANSLMGGYNLGRLEQMERDREAETGRILADNLVGKAPTSAPGSPAAPSIGGDTKPEAQSRVARAMMGADTRGGSDDFMGFVRKQEGWNPKPYGDYKQTSIGYGTKALPGETSITPEEGERRLRTEVGQARQLVQAWARDNGVTLSPKREDAFTDLTYNAGTEWMRSGLGQAARQGDWNAAQQRFLQYNRAGGRQLPGLVARRQAAAPWLLDGTMPAPDMMAEGGLPVSPGGPAMTQGASPIATGSAMITPQAPVRMAQAPGAPQSDAAEFALPPRVQDQVRVLLANPRTRAAGMALYDRYHENWMKRNGDPLDRQIREAQLAQYGANTDKLRAEAEEARRKASMPPGAFKDPKQLADVEESIRKEFSSYAKPYIETRDAFNRIQQSAEKPSAAGDIALIFNYMKMLDPGSVVREGEFATAQNAAGIDDRIVNLYNRLMNGERLNAAQRADFVGQASGLFARVESQYLDTQEQYRALAERMRIDPRNVILDYSIPKPKKQDRLPQAGATGGIPNAPAPNAAAAPAPSVPAASTERIGATRNIGGRLYQKSANGQWIAVQQPSQAYGPPVPQGLTTLEQ